MMYNQLQPNVVVTSGSGGKWVNLQATKLFIVTSANKGGGYSP